MCGITGFIAPGASEDALLAMTRALTHRGPDSDGRWRDPEAGIALGHRRLAIVDLTPSGHQPMVSASGRFVMTFNGEIYNFMAIRAELEQAGFTFRGTSDTEVMLAAFERWGLEPAVKRFVGMFAFALWDRERHTLSLVRDRLGEKPLYYGRIGGCLLFGSELKALEAHPAWRGEIQREAIALLLRHNYIQPPHTIFRGVHQLVPGTILTVGPSGEPGQPVPYWSAREAAEAGLAAPFEGTTAEAVSALEALLAEAIRHQRLADVPLGAFLSGGIDSSTVVALMQAQSDRPIKTFTIGFHERGYDEAAHARAIARHLGTDHTELYVSPREVLEVIPSLPRLFDEPFADSSQLPTFLVSRLARRHVTVALSGDGGDEIFAGYARYVLAEAYWRRINAWPGGPRALAGRALRAIGPEAWLAAMRPFGPFLPATLRRGHPGEKVHKLGELLGVRHPEQLYQQLVSHCQPARLLAPSASEPPTPFADPGAWPASGDVVSRLMLLDMLTYLPADILTKVDRATMGVSLETRAPFLDHRLVEFAWKVPLSLKLRHGEGKWLLRRVLDRYVPPALTERPKMGFSMPVGAWLCGPLREWAEALLDPSRLKQQGFLDPAAVEALWAGQLSGERSEPHLLWSVLMFQAWLEERQSRQAAAA